MHGLTDRIYFKNTPAQNGIWLGQKIAGNSAQYNASEYIFIKGSLNSGQLVAAANQILPQVESLNVTFDFEKEIHFPSKKPIKLVQIDFTQDTDPFNKAILWMQEDLKIPLDIYKGYLYSLALLKIKEKKWMLYIKIHHIACDGYGFALLTKKIFDVYESFDTPKFNDYKTAIENDIHYSQSESHKKSHAYWLEKINKAPTPVSFSLATGEIADDCYRHKKVISTILRKKLESVALQLKVTWSDILISSVVCVLSLSRAQGYISIGLPTMGRIGTPALKVPMMSMNIVPLAVQIKPEQTLAEITQAVAMQIKEDKPHHRFRYETMRANARKLNPASGGEIWGPVVNIMPFSRKPKLDNCDLVYHNLSAGPVEDISFSFILNHDKSVGFTLDGNPNKYSQNDVKVIAERVFDFINKFDIQQHSSLHYDKNNFSWLESESFSTFPKNSSSYCIWDRIQSIAIQYPEKKALQCNSEELTYAEMVHNVDTLAKDLLNLGLKKGNRCALALPRSINAIVACLACLKIGVAFVFIDKTAPQKRNKAILQNCKPQLILVESKHDANLYTDCFLVGYFTHKKTLKLINSPYLTQSNATQNTTAPNEWMHNEAYIIYTSGSTGTPKGVIINHEALSCFISSAIKTYQFVEYDRVLQFAPLHFDACLEEIFCTLCSGGTLILRNKAMLESITAFLQQCTLWNITLLDLPTAFWHELAYSLAEHNQQLPSSVRAVIIGGEEAKKERLNQWINSVGTNVHLFNSYGPTEATVVATVEPLHKNTNDQTKISLGKPLAGRAIAVVDEQLNILPKGESGELVLLGAGLAQGYIDLPEVNTQAFFEIYFPWLNQPLRAYRTGDRGLLDENNNLYYKGRLDDEIKISGHRIAPSEIESALASLPYIEETAITIADKKNQPKIVAHITGRHVQEHYFNTQVLREKLVEILPPTMLPVNLMLHQSLPKTKSGKINRQALSQKYKKTEFETSSIDDEFNFVRACWQEILGNHSYQKDDNFFDLGGQSLQVIQLANRLSGHFKKVVTANILFQNPTLETMTHAILGVHEKTYNVNSIKQHIENDIVEFEKKLHLIKPSIPTHKNILKNVLVTGANGFLGAHLVSHLLGETSAKVQCLIRAKNKKQALDKLIQAFEDFKLPLSILSFALHKSHLTIVLADLQKTGLGFSAKEKHSIFSSTTCIFHSAAITSVTRDYHSLCRVNTLATGELLKLSKEFNIPFRFISTIAIAPPKQEGEQLTEDFVSFHKGLSDGYQQTKWAAEAMAKSASRDGVDVRVYRLGRIVGALSSGYVNPKDFVWQILSAGLKLGYLPDLPIEEPWTPVDELAEFIVQHQLNDNTEYQVLNMIPQHRVHLPEVYQWLQNEGYLFDVVTPKNWCEKIRISKNEQNHALVAFFEQKTIAFKNGANLESAPICSSNFDRQLIQQKQYLTHIQCEQFNTYLDFARKHSVIKTIPLSKPEKLSTNIPTTEFVKKVVYE